MKNRVNGFLKNMFWLQETSLGTTKFDHVEPKEKFFASCILSILSILSEFVAFCLFSSSSRFYWEGYYFEFPHNFSESFPKALYHERTRAH